MKNKSISKALAVLLSCVLFISSNSVYVYAEPSNNETEAECEAAELITEYEETVSEDIQESESTAEELVSEIIEEATIESASETAEEAASEIVEEQESEAAESASETVEETQSEIEEEAESTVIESESEIEEETQSDDTEELRDASEQDWDEINSGILEEYDTLMKQLKDGSIEFPFSESGISEKNETSILNNNTGVCTGSRLNYIKKYIIANGVKSENKYTVAAVLTNNNTTFSMQYNSSSNKVEFILLVQSTLSSGTVAKSMTSFYAEDNATKQTVSYVFLTDSSPQMAYTADAEVKPAELKQDDVVDFSIDFAYPESMRSTYDDSLDELASSSLELLLLGMDIWFTQIFGSNVTIGNFGFLCYASPATNHIWGNWVNDEDRKYRTCGVCGETDEYTDDSELDGDWKQDAVTGIKWKFSEGVLTVEYEGNLDYGYSMPWEYVSEDVTILILQEGITGFSEDVTYDLPNLTEIQIPTSCINIEDVWYAFDFNDNLEKINVSAGNPNFLSVDGVLYNNSGEKLLFYPLNKPDEEFTLPDACTEIDDLYSYKVKELNLGSNLKTIDGFVGGENVTLIRVPATLQNIRGSVFDVTEKLQNIIIDENNPYLCYENNALLSKDRKVIYEVMPCISSTTYEIPATVEEIFSEAFFYNNKIQKLIIPKNVKKIGGGAFADMRKIQKICLLSTTVQFTGKPFSTVGKDEAGTFYVPSESSKSIIEGILKECNINNVKLIVDTSLDVSNDDDLSTDEEDNYSVYYTDQRTDLSGCTIANIKSKVYDGKAYTPMPKVTLFVGGKNKNLVYGTDYRLVYTNNINAGQGTVKVIGIGRYKGSNSKSFSITEKNMGKLTKFASSIAVGDLSTDPIEVYDGTKLLTKGVDYDYTITKSDVQKIGTANIVVSALPESNYVGTSIVKLPVIDDNDKILIKASDITLSETEYDYDGRACTPRVTVTVDGTVLQKKDYSVTYKNNKNCGMAYVIVKGKGKSYTGTAAAFFKIVTASGKTSFDSVVVNKGKNVTYNGKLQKPAVVVMMNGKKLAVNKDYTLEYTNHLNAGWGKVKITGIGNYEGLNKDVTFKIEQRMIKNTSISVKSSTNYTVKYAGKVLVEGIDYEVERQEISGTNKVNLKFKGLKNFSGEITKKNVKN